MTLTSSTTLITFLLITHLTTGCVAVLLGAGAAGGYAASKDEIEGVTQEKFDRVFRVAKDVIRDNGFLRVEDALAGEIEAEVEGSEVKMTIRQITDKSVQLRVQARKGYKLLPNIKLAQRLFNQIMQEL